MLLGGSWDLVRKGSFQGPFKESMGCYKDLGFRVYLEDYGTS